MSPPWLYTGLTRESVEEKVTTAGLDDGRFLVRTRDGKHGEFVICVVYKGKPTHHPAKPDDSGQIMVNKKGYGCSDIVSLVKKLGSKQPGWPVPLDKPVNAPGGGGGGGGGAKKKAAKGKVKKPGYIHDKLSREDAIALITEAGMDNGRFLLRTREGKPGEYVLCVVHKGKPTHHLITKNAEGLYICNNKAFGNTKKIVVMIETLAVKFPEWPVPLDKPVNRKTKGAAAEDDDAGAKKALQAAEKAKEEAQKAKEEAAAAKAEAEKKAKEQAEAKEAAEAKEKDAAEEPKAEPAKDPEPEPAATEPAAVNEATSLANAAKAAAELAVKEVAEKKKELEELKKQAQLPESEQSYRLEGAYPGQGTSTDAPVGKGKMTPMLARSVIKMGSRLSELEMQMHQLVQLMGALRDHARRIGMQQ